MINNDMNARIQANIEMIEEGQGDDVFRLTDDEIKASAAMQYAIEVITGQPCDYVVIEGRTVTYVLVDGEGNTGDEQTFNL